MKFSSILLVLLIGLSIGCFSQQKNAPSSSMEELLIQSKKQKTAAYIFLGSGAAATGIGTILINNNFCIFVCSFSQKAALEVGAGLFLAGGAAMLTSIPIFISASNKSKRAYRISAKYQDILLPELGQNGSRTIPAVNLSVSLNRQKGY
jgi:hypothetical protein